MPSGAIGEAWATSSWLDTAWLSDAWGLSAADVSHVLAGPDATFTVGYRHSAFPRETRHGWVLGFRRTALKRTR